MLVAIMSGVKEEDYNVDLNKEAELVSNSSASESSSDTVTLRSTSAQKYAALIIFLLVSFAFRMWRFLCFLCSAGYDNLLVYNILTCL